MGYMLAKGPSTKAILPHSTLKKYRENYYKITLHRRVRRAGYEAAGGEAEYIKGKKDTAGNERELECNLSRAKSKIYELAMHNERQWFVTLTLIPDYDRTDLTSYKKNLSVWKKTITAYMEQK